MNSKSLSLLALSAVALFASSALAANTTTSTNGTASTNGTTSTTNITTSNTTQDSSQVPKLNNLFLGCTKAGNYYCQNGICYNQTIGNASFLCSNNFEKDYDNHAFPATNALSYKIDHQELITMQLVANQSWIYLKDGESIRINVQSLFEKSTFVDLSYNGDNQYNKTDNKTVQFFVYNNRLKGVRKFDMTEVDKVLLPQSNDNFTLYLAANKGDFNITITASESIFGRIVSLVTLSLAMTIAFAL